MPEALSVCEINFDICEYHLVVSADFQSLKFSESLSVCNLSVKNFRTLLAV